MWLVEILNWIYFLDLADVRISVYSKYFITILRSAKYILCKGKEGIMGKF